MLHRTLCLLLNDSLEHRFASFKLGHPQAQPAILKKVDIEVDFSLEADFLDLRLLLVACSFRLNGR